MNRFFAATAAVAALLAGSAAQAETLRWPELPKSPITLVVLQRAPSVAAYLTPVADRAAARCPAGHSCIVCLAGCDDGRPALVHSMVPRSTTNKSTAQSADASENDTDGIADNAPRFAREEWAGIVCGSESGCRGAGIPPPRAVEINISVHKYRH